MCMCSIIVSFNILTPHLLDRDPVRTIRPVITIASHLLHIFKLECLINERYHTMSVEGIVVLMLHFVSC